MQYVSAWQRNGINAPMQKEAANGIREKIDLLLQSQTNLVIASVTGDGMPLASQAPFVVDDQGNFLVLVSGLAEHGRSLRMARQVHIMIMVDEARLANPFARERLTYLCSVAQLDPVGTVWQDAQHRMKRRFGKFVETLLQLPDFCGYRLTPIEGRYVAGFGEAFALRNGDIEPVRK
jgi:putative heme iron utilization protein